VNMTTEDGGTITTEDGGTVTTEDGGTSTTETDAGGTSGQDAAAAMCHATTDDPCTTCLAASCCDQATACAADSGGVPLCGGFFPCACSGTAVECSTACGVPDAGSDVATIAANALYVCAATNCESSCSSNDAGSFTLPYSDVAGPPGGNPTTEFVYDDSCESALNGSCDAPPVCADGTDATDCSCTSEGNTTPETAIDLGAISDCDPSFPYTQYATLTGAPGSQLFKVTGNDVAGCIVDPEITITSLGSVPGLCVYADCGPQGGTVTCNTFETAVELPTDTLGTLQGCCADDPSGVGATPTISCNGNNDSADVYIEITSETSECAGFWISYRY
jgi:hypothetical protein